MVADDKESDERRQSCSLERDRGKHCRRHRSDSPSPTKQIRKRSRSPSIEEKHRRKHSAEKHEDSKGPELSNRNTEGPLEEDNGREVARKNGVEDDEKAGVGKSSKEDRRVELHSSGDSSEDAYSESESDRGRKKSRSKNHKSWKSKRKHHRHVHSESEQDESQTEDTSGESFEDSEDEYRRAKRQKRLKQKERAERERRRRNKEKKRKMKEKARVHEKRKKTKENVEKRAKRPIIDDVGDCVEGDNMHGESSNTDPFLDPKHKIFLSHSGAQKEFVDHLCKALEDRSHYPFFDRRHESLPKGERFPELIVRAVEQCEMLIVVVSNEYFMSKWPMIELSAFVKAHKLHHGSNIGPKILPLFYGLSVSDLDDEGMRKKWFQEWKTLAEADSKKRIVVSDWKNALDVLKSFNGLLYDRNLKEVVAYEDEIVSHVCKSIAPDIKWDDSHVQGKSHICKVIGEKIEGIGVSQRYKVKVVGIYGVGGIGKTTTCKTLCNELLSKYEGRVCHIEFPHVPSSDSEELFQKVLRDLTRKSGEFIQPLNEGECKDILRKSLFKQRTFLVIDNILDNHQSIEKAKMFLEVPYHMESLVVVTARSPSVLRHLGLDGDACLEMPDLGEVDAVKLFLHHAVGGRQFFEDGEKHDIMTCVGRCYFSKGNGEGHHYHPLALKVLGLQLGCHGENPSLWVKNLPRVSTFNFFPGENPVFDILRSNFDLLPPRDQALILDAGCFLKFLFVGELIEWLCFVHNQDEEEIALRLEHLKRKGLLQDVDLRCRRVSMHDLYLEFAELEAKGSFNESTNFRERVWVYMEDGDLAELESKPESGCWHKLIRLSIIDTLYGQIRSMEGMKWDYFSNVEVLRLHKLHWGHGAFNLEGLLHLRILVLCNISKLDRVEGLENLKHLVLFQWASFQPHSSNGPGAHIVGQLPSSLRRLYISGECIVLGVDLLARCHNLSKLVLHDIEAGSLDLSNCRCLESVSLPGIQKLQTLLALVACTPSNLHSFQVYGCKDLVDIPGIDHLSGLKNLSIMGCPKWEVPSLLALTDLQVLFIGGEPRLMVSTKDCFPCQLRQLHWYCSRLSVGLNLFRSNQLEVLDLMYNDGLTSLAELGDLLALRRLDLRFCKHLLRLPDLSMSRKLKELNLEGCSALELHERDIQMLSELPLLQPVPFFGEGEDGMFKLDFARGKLLFRLLLGEWEERDLGAPPIKIRQHGTW